MDASASKEYRVVVLLPGSGGLSTNGREVSPSGQKPANWIPTRDPLSQHSSPSPCWLLREHD